MVSVAERAGEPSALRALHDLLEDAYFSLARTSDRWFERRHAHALLGGFAGLDSSTMNRVALLEAPHEAALDDVLAEAAEFFGDRRLPWSVQLTPFARPPGAAALLRRRGYWCVSELTVMTHSPLADPPHLRPRTPPVDVRALDPDEVGRFTQFVIDAFRLPARFHPALADVNSAWMDAGATAYFAYVDDRPVGTALLTRNDGVAGIYNVATLRQHRRRGIATALMRRLIEDHRARPERVLTLQVAKGSVAEAFYERIGFLPRYRWEVYAAEGG